MGGRSGNGGTGGPGCDVSGTESRVGRFVIVKVHDPATPGAAGDGIRWKWFAPADASCVAIISTWPEGQEEDSATRPLSAATSLFTCRRNRVARLVPMIEDP